ncbi:unnamed protein product [Discula destructiva]
MSQSRDRDMMSHPSSPPSEGGAESYKYEDTPDTRLTVFSLQDDSAKSSRLLNALTLSTGNNDRPIKFGVTDSPIHRMASMDSIASVIHEKDPFISTTPEKTRLSTKLSATASAFKPATFRPSSAEPITVNAPANNLATPKPIDRLLETVPRSPITGYQVWTDLPLAAAFSHELHLSRSMRITCSSGSVDNNAITQYLVNLQSSVGTFQSPPSVFPAADGVYVRISNVRDAAKVLMDSTVRPHGWKIEPVSAQTINKAAGVAAPAHEHEGLHTILISPIVPMTDIQLQARIREHFKHYDFFAMVKQPSSLLHGTMQWVVEWSDADATRACASYLYNLGWVNVDNLFSFLVAPFSPGSQTLGMPDTSSNRLRAQNNEALQFLEAYLGHMSLYGSQLPVQSPAVSTTRSGLNSSIQAPQWPSSWSHGRQSSQARFPGIQNPLTRGHTPASSDTAFSLMSPQNFSLAGQFSPPMSGPISARTSFSSTRLNQGFQRIDAFQRSNDRRQNASRVNRSSFSPPGPHHNHVDINKIREGTDVRTTIMLRNIPNKVDQAMLKNIIDESSWGKYDFMYLRIDFANDCNVGYAFINFVDPLDIIDFVNARGNQRWNCFKSDKVAEISYATIQGKDCLVQKFRNSSVMLEHAHYRPKLYYTSNGPIPEMAGQEEIFPEPDNQSKMKRSCENAEHVGLFTPNAGQHFRDEQRRRRSQYDRGTRLAALEECDYGMYAHQEPMH